jgi:hypothetical protein
MQQVKIETHTGPHVKCRLLLPGCNNRSGRASFSLSIPMCICTKIRSALRDLLQTDRQTEQLYSNRHLEVFEQLRLSSILFGEIQNVVYYGYRHDVQRQTTEVQCDNVILGNPCTSNKLSH